MTHIDRARKQASVRLRDSSREALAQSYRQAALVEEKRENFEGAADLRMVADELRAGKIKRARALRTNA